MRASTSPGVIHRAQTARTAWQGCGGADNTELLPTFSKSRQGSFTVAYVQCDAEPLRKVQKGTTAIMMLSGSHHLGRVSLIVITSENVIKRKIFGHERDLVITSPGLIVEDVIQLL